VTKIRQSVQETSRKIPVRHELQEFDPLVVILTEMIRLAEKEEREQAARKAA
jgi:hypothetical protein